MRSAFKFGTFLSLCLGAAMASCGSNDTPAPSASGSCGNGVVDQGEQCDGPNLPSGVNCATATSGAQPSGTLGCNPSCQFDISQCTGGMGGGAGMTGQP